MMANIHFLRPWWFLALLPLLVFLLLLWQQKPKLKAWEAICDPHLLAHLLQKQGQKGGSNPLFFLFLSVFFFILSASGPTWYQLSVPAYKPILPRVLVLDLSEHMMESDLSPDRLSRAKFKLRDILSRKDVGQFGLVVFTGEPFVVSPLTDDGQTIAALLPTLTPDIMPVGGHRLETALSEAAQLIHGAGYKRGQILVLTADAPLPKAIARAKTLAAEGIDSSVLALRSDKILNPLFQQFASAGNGALFPYSPDPDDLNRWLSLSTNQASFALSSQEDIPLWRDEGRWFLIPCLLLLLPLFRRGFLQGESL